MPPFATGQPHNVKTPHVMEIVTDRMSVFPPNSYVEALTCNVMVFRDGAFGVIKFR